MPTVNIKCLVVGYHFDWMMPDEIHWTASSGVAVPPLDETMLHAQVHEFEVEVPDLNIVARQVAGLEAAKQQALQEYQEKVGKLDEKLSKLLALEHTA